MGKAQGKKVDPSAVAAEAIEAQPSFGQIKPSEATWFARSDSTRRRRGGYRMTRTRGQARQAKEKKHLRTDGRHCMSGPRPHNAPHGGSCRICWRRHPGPIEPLQRPRSGHALGIRDRSSRPVEIANRGSSALPATSADQAMSRRRQCLSGTGRAESAMRAQAVAATTIAPVTATACRQPSADMPMCARPSAACDR